jgi:hypothetical protein
MKKLTLLLASALLLSGLAIAQSHDERRYNPDQQNNADQQDRAMADNHDRAPAERITNGPVVENVGNSWATVAWSTDTGGSSVVHYGTDRNRLTEMAETPYDVSKGDHGITHRVKIDHLRPGTTYFYVVDSGQGQGTGTEARSRVEEFTTKR